MTLILWLAHSFTVHCAQDMCGWGAVRTWSVLLGWKPIMEPPFSPYSHPALLTTSLSLSPALICSLLDCKKLKSRNCSLLILTPPSHQLPLACSLSFSGHPMSIVWAIESLTSQLMIVANARQEPSFAQKAITKTAQPRLSFCQVQDLPLPLDLAFQLVGENCRCGRMMPNTNAGKQVLTRKRSRKPPSLLHFHLLLFFASVPLFCWILEYFALSDVFIAFQNCHEIKDTDVTPPPTLWEILFQSFISLTLVWVQYKCIFSSLWAATNSTRFHKTSVSAFC